MNGKFRPDYSCDGPGGMTNGKRAYRAGKALTAYCGKDLPNQTTETHLQDLLCDLMHLAHRDEIDFNKVLIEATACHLEERGELLWATIYFNGASFPPGLN